MTTSSNRGRDEGACNGIHHHGNSYGYGDRILIGGEEGRYHHPILGSHAGKCATVIHAANGLDAHCIPVMLDDHPSVQFEIRIEDIRPRLSRDA